MTRLKTLICAMHNQSILMLKAFLLLMLVLLTSTGCFSRNLLRFMSTVSDGPVENVNSINGFEKERYRLCVTGDLKKEGPGEYRVDINPKHFAKAKLKCRNEQFVMRNGKRVCKNDMVPVIHIRKQDIHWGCNVSDYHSSPDHFVLISGATRRQLIIQDAYGHDLVEVKLKDIYEDTNPIAYGLLPITLVLDIVTAPAQMLGNYMMAGEVYVKHQQHHDATPRGRRIYARQ